MDDARILALFDKFWDWRIKNSPEFGTFCGFHNYDNLLEIYTLEAIKSRKAAAEEFLNEAIQLSAIYNVQSYLKQHLAIFIVELEVYLKGHKAKGYCFPLNHLEGPHLEFQRLITSMKYDTKDDYEKLLSRFSSLPAQISQIIDMMQTGMKEDLTYHSVSVESIPDQINHLDTLEKSAKESVFYKPFENFPATLSDDEKEVIIDRGVDLISNNVIPAFQSLKKFLLTDYFNKCRPLPEISCVPGGADFYQLCLDFHLGYHITPKEVHQMGLLEVERITKEIEKVICSLGYENLSVKDFTNQLRNDENFFKKNPEEIIDSYKNMVFNKIYPKLDLLFKQIPQEELKIEPFPQAMSEGPAAFYLAGTPDGSRAGVFYVLNKDVKSAPIYQMTALALHEAVPGHHFQQSHLFNQKNLPNFRKYVEDRKYSEAPTRFPLNTAYMEGWGLYSEYLGYELGLYEDKYDHFGYLSQEIFRATRLVVDTGLHAFNWTREQAVSYMMDKTASSQKDIENEVNRYITWPGQACAYKIGEMKIKSLRKMAEKELGSKFDIKDFHEVILNNCGPLDVLEQKVLEYAEAPGTSMETLSN